MAQHTKQAIKGCDHRVGETTVLQGCSERHLAFSSLETYSSPVRNKVNRVGDGIFKLKHPHLDSNFIMSQKPSNVLIPTLGKELTSVLQIIGLIFDTQHLPIYHKIWV